MGDTGGKSARRPGTHLQVEASGPRNAASVQQRLAGRFRRGEVVEGCAGGAEGRSKRLICLRETWMGDTGGKSGRRPGRHLQVEASGTFVQAFLLVFCRRPRFLAPRRRSWRAAGAPHRGQHVCGATGRVLRPGSRAGRLAGPAERPLCGRFVAVFSVGHADPSLVTRSIHHS